MPTPSRSLRRSLRRSFRWSFRTASLAGLLALALALPAGAQQNLDFEIRGGVAVPAGDLGEVGATGAGVGVGLSYELTEMIGLRVDGDLEVLSENRVNGDAIMPRTYLWHYHAGLELDLLEGPDSPWRVRARGSAGGTTYDTEEFTAGGDDFLDTYFSAAGGLSVGRQVRESLEVGVIGQAFFVFTDEERTAEFVRYSSLLNPFSTASSFPVEIYLRWTR